MSHDDKIGKIASNWNDLSTKAILLLEAVVKQIARVHLCKKRRALFARLKVSNLPTFTYLDEQRVPGMGFSNG